VCGVDCGAVDVVGGVEKRLNGRGGDFWNARNVGERPRGLLVRSSGEVERGRVCGVIEHAKCPRQVHDEVLRYELAHRI
jgi:hypothetical protein